MRDQMACSSSTMTVVDVYDAAASIGKEFERIIDSYGAEAVTELMPKVISVLEQLEILANNAQKENAEIGELTVAVERLTAEKVAKTEERHRYEQASNVLMVIMACSPTVAWCQTMQVTSGVESHD